MDVDALNLGVAAVKVMPLSGVGDIEYVMVPVVVLEAVGRFWSAATPS